MGQIPPDDDEPEISIEGFDPEIPTPRPLTLPPAATGRPSSVERVLLQDDLDRQAAQEAQKRLTDVEARVGVLEADRRVIDQAIRQWRRFRRYLVAWIDLDRSIAADAEGVRRQWRSFRKFLVTWLRERD